ncbi:4Fe-4S binding protein [Desulfuromonas sp. AOP6]|uniref:4Fe-4S binding protein n=1 Tax=Desulfuromonas sp. AOP6 TaxID=1566351 RepID=UPI00126C6CCB|nr:4Fe-4S binding protein [Desulfuromonas sp. AOP6]BCA81103.1 (Fe-S)-binding protein [Desulfuromonas sp. AOP6]
MTGPARPAPKAMAPRYAVQAGFLLFYLWIGWRFALWAAALAGSQTPAMARPAAVDGFLPISGLMGLRHWAQTGELHPVHPAAALILLAAILTALLLKRGFCSWVCPIFPLSEGLWRLGKRLTGRTFAPPFWLDLPLRSLKYLLLGFFVYQILWMMPLPALRAFLSSPYHKIADVRMLHFFQDPSLTFLAFIAAMVLLSLFVQMPWCRYLCPYGALLGLFSLLSLSKIRRNERHCIRCGLCSSRCTAWLPVMHKRTIRSAECYGCYRCVQGCPAPGALQMQAGGRPIPSVLFGLAVVALFVVISLAGRFSGHWHSQVPLQEISHWLQLPR